MQYHSTQSFLPTRDNKSFCGFPVSRKSEARDGRTDKQTDGVQHFMPKTRNTLWNEVGGLSVPLPRYILHITSLVNTENHYWQSFGHLKYKFYTAYIATLLGHMTSSVVWPFDST